MNLRFDFVVQIFDLPTGQQISSIVFPVSVTAVTMDALERFLFVGGADGKIFQVLTDHMELSDLANRRLAGHR
jgi:hypothetical protein